MKTLLELGKIAKSKPTKLEDGRSVYLDVDTGAPLSVRAVVGNENDPQRRLEIMKQYYPDAVGFFESPSLKKIAKEKGYGEDNFIFTDIDKDGNQVQKIYNPTGLLPDLGDIASVGRDIVETIAYVPGAVAGTGAAGPVVGTLVGGALAAEGAGQAYDRLMDFLAKEYVARGTITEETKDAFLRVGINVLAPGFIDKIVNKVKNISVKGTVQKVFGITPTVANKSKDLLKRAEKLGIDVPTLGQLVDSTSLQYLEKRLQQAPLSAAKYAEILKNYQQSLGNAVVTIAEKYGKPIQQADEIGFFLSEQAKRRAKDINTTVDRLYNKALGLIPKNEKTNLPALRNYYNELVAKEETGIVDSGLEVVKNRLKKILDKADKLGGFTAETLKENRTIINRDVRLLEKPMSGGQIGVDTVKTSLPYLKSVKNIMQQDLDDLVETTGGPEAIKALTKARNYRASIQGRDLDTLVNPILKRGEDLQGEKVFNFALQGTKAGSEKIRQIYKNILNEEGRENLSSSIITRMGLKKPDGASRDDWSVSTFLRNFDDMSTEAKNVIFKGNLKKDLQTIVDLAKQSKSLDAFANPSGTGLSTTAGATYLLTALSGGVGYTASGGTGAAIAAGSVFMAPYFARELMTNQKFIRWVIDSSKKMQDDPNYISLALSKLAAGATEKEASPEYQDAVQSYINTLLFNKSKEPSVEEEKRVEIQPMQIAPSPTTPDVNILLQSERAQQAMAQGAKDMGMAPMPPAPMPTAQAPMPPQGGLANLQQAQQFGALFPQDSTGQLIAQGKTNV